MPLTDFLPADGFWAEVRLVDLLDIAIVALALSVVLSWLKRRSTRPLLVAAVMGLAVYALARWLNLYLTLQVFRVGVVIVLAATLLAYQEDLRRGFERLAAGQIFRRRRSNTESIEQTTMTLTEAAFDLAERKFGALIVVRGAEQLERHLRGGWPVGGRPSVPLLLSIFDPHTPAHDGAAVIDEHGRLERIGVHLPLTSNLAALAGRGTRHAAALGLAESSDAFVIAVSEERGQVSVARGEQIEPVATHEELAAQLRGWLASKRPGPGRRRSRGPRDLEVKIAAVALSLGLWFAFAAPSEPVQRTYPVRVELRNAPPGWTLEGPFPAEVNVTLAGPEPVFGGLAPEDLRLAFDLAKIRPGENRLPAEQGSVNVPAPITVERFDAETIYLLARPPGEGSGP